MPTTKLELKLNKKLIDKLNKKFENELSSNRGIDKFFIRIFIDKNNDKNYIVNILYYRYKDINSSYIDYGSKSKTHISYKHNFTICFEADTIDLEFRLLRSFRQFDRFAVMRDRLSDNKRENKRILLLLKNNDELKEIPGIIMRKKDN